MLYSKLSVPLFLGLSVAIATGLIAESAIQSDSGPTPERTKDILCNLCNVNPGTNPVNVEQWNKAESLPLAQKYYNKDGPKLRTHRWSPHDVNGMARVCDACFEKDRRFTKRFSFKITTTVKYATMHQVWWALHRPDHLRENEVLSVEMNGKPLNTTESVKLFGRSPTKEEQETMVEDAITAKIKNRPFALLASDLLGPYVPRPKGNLKDNSQYHLFLNVQKEMARQRKAREAHAKAQSLLGRPTEMGLAPSSDSRQTNPKAVGMIQQPTPGDTTSRTAGSRRRLSSEPLIDRIMRENEERLRKA